MARVTRPLTNTEVKQAKPKQKEFNLVDGDGLALRVKPNGSKLWVFNYVRPYTKKQTSLGFGSYPTVSLAEARSKRNDARELLAKDIDPKEHRDDTNRLKDIAQSNTLEHIAEKWLEVKKSTVSDNHAADTWRSLELHIFLNLGKVPIHKITAIKTIDVIEPIAAKGSLETVKRLCQRLNEIMIYAVNTGITSSNPLRGISKAFQLPKKQHLPTLTPQCVELLEVMKPISSRSDFVFPLDRNPRTHTNPQTANMALKRMAFDKQLVAHGLRSLASTVLNEQGFDADFIEAALSSWV